MGLVMSYRPRRCAGSTSGGTSVCETPPRRVVQTAVRDPIHDTDAPPNRYDDAVAREGRALWTLWQVHQLQARGAFHRRARRTRREGLLAPGLLLATQMSLPADLFETLRVTLHGTGHPDASVPFANLQYGADRGAAVSHDATVGEALDYLRRMQAGNEAMAMLSLDDIGAPVSADRVDASSDISIDAGETEATTETPALSEAKEAPPVFRLRGGTAAPDEDTLDARNAGHEANDTGAAFTFPEAVNGSTWAAMTASAAFWDEPDTVAVSAEMSAGSVDDAEATLGDVASPETVGTDPITAPCENTMAADPLEDAAAIVSLVCASGSASTFDAAIAAMPAMRCDLRARYRLIKVLLGEVVLRVSVPHRRAADPSTAVTLLDLEKAIDAVGESPLVNRTRIVPLADDPVGGDVRTAGSAPDAMNRTVSTAPDENDLRLANDVQGVGVTHEEDALHAATDVHDGSDVPVCDRIASALFDDVGRRHTLLDAIRFEIRQGVALLDDALADLRRHRWTTRPNEFGDMGSTSAHFAEAALGALRQARVSNGEAESPVQDRQWSDLSLLLLQGEMPDLNDIGSGDACRAVSQHAVLRSRFAATLLVMRFDRWHALGVADPHFLGQLLRYIVMSTPEPAWEAGERVPTVGALLRYGARLTQAYDDEQGRMQAIAFMPMKVFRTECYVAALRHTRSKRLWNPVPLSEQVRGAAYRRCFLFTNPSSRERYQVQFTRYRQHDAPSHARYLAEILLQRGNVHPLEWRRQGRVYTIQYERRANRVTRLLGRHDAPKTLWQARVVWLGSTASSISCRDTDKPDSLALSSLAPDDACQRALDTLSWPRRFPLGSAVGLVVHTGVLDLGWMPEGEGSDGLYERRLTFEALPAPDDRTEVRSDNATVHAPPRSRTAVADILHVARADATSALQQYVDAFERDHYMPGSAEWAFKWLPFYGAIEKERGKDTYRVNWRRVALDTVEVVAVLTWFGLPVKALGHAALRAGRAAIRLARRGRLAPLSRAYSVLRHALPHLRRATRLARRGGQRLSYGFRRGSAETWRTLRRLYWNRTRAWSLAGRARALGPPPASMSHADRSYLAHIEAAFNRHVGMRAMMQYPAGMCHDAALLGREILRMVSDRVMYRGVLIWREGALQPANHIVLLVRRGTRTYVVDPTVSQFSRFSAGFERALFVPEGQWQALYRHGFYNEVVKFADFKTLAQTERLFGVVPRRLGDSLQSSKTLVSPPWYRLGG